MKMRNVIDHVSEIYREECIKIKALRKELNNVLCELMNIDYTKGENVSLARYNYLIEQRKHLEREIDLKSQYSDGISCVREYLMDLGFDTEVE